MTREEREDALNYFKNKLENEVYGAKYNKLAIEALEPTTKIEESNFSQEQYKADLQSAYDCGKSVIDKIRAEIGQLRAHKAQFLTSDNKVCIDSQDVLDVIDKYRGENEVKSWEI